MPADNSKDLLYNTFLPLKELGRGGMGRVLLVRAERESPGFRDFLASIIAWHEVNRHKQIRPLREKIVTINASIYKLGKEESDLMDQGEEDAARDIRESIKNLQVRLDTAVSSIKKKQEEYINKRSIHLSEVNENAMIQYLNKIGLPYPDDDMFAMKQVLIDDEKYCKRLQDEFRSLKLIQHKNVLTVYTSGNHYYVMEFIDNMLDPEDVISRPGSEHGSFRNYDRIQIIAAASKAVAEAHRYGIIHRDIKPDNIGVCEDGSVKLFDFGLVKSVETEGVTQTGTAIGTPHYMSPEQIESAKDAMPSFDIYALGASLYHYITGQKPYSTARNKYSGKEKRPKSSQDVIITVANRSFEPLPPSEIASGIPHVLEQIILKAIAKDKEYRYQSAREFTEDLEKYLELENNDTLSSSSFFNMQASDLDMRVKRRRSGSRKSRRGLPLIGELGTPYKVIMGTAAVLCVIIGINFFFSSDRDNPEPSEKPDTDLIDDRPPEESDNIEKVFSYVLTYEKEHPENFEDTIEKYKSFLSIDEVRGTVWEFKARDALEKTRKRQKAKAAAIVKDLAVQARKIADSGDYDRAVSVFSTIPEQFAGIAVPLADQAVEELTAEAEEKIMSVLSSAETLSEQGSPGKGLESLADLSHIRYKKLSGSVEMLKRRLKQEQKKKTESIRKKVEEVSAQKMKHIWDRFDSELFGGNYRQAGVIINRVVRDGDLTNQKSTEKTLAQLKQLFSEIVAIKDRQKKAVESLKKLKGREMHLETEKGIVKGRVRAVRDNVIYLAVEFRAEGVSGTAVRKIPFDTLTDKQRNKLIPRVRLQTPVEWLASACIQLGELKQSQKSINDTVLLLTGIENAFEKAEACAVAPHYKKHFLSTKKEKSEMLAEKEWHTTIAPLVRRDDLDTKGAAELRNAIDAFVEKYSGTEFIKTVKTEVNVPEVETERKDIPADALTWNGTGENKLWSSPENWSGNRIPGEGDNAVFSGGSGDCIIDKPVTVESMTLSSAYQGKTVLQSTLHIEHSLMISGGSLQTGPHSIETDYNNGNGTFIINGGEMKCGTGIHTVKGNFAFIKGNLAAEESTFVFFAGNTGRSKFNPATCIHTGNIRFNNVRFTNSLKGSSHKSIMLEGRLYVQGTLFLDGYSTGGWYFCLLGNERIDCFGDLIGNNRMICCVPDIYVCGRGDQVIEDISIGLSRTFCIKKPEGDALFKGDIAFMQYDHDRDNLKSEARSCRVDITSPVKCKGCHLSLASRGKGEFIWNGSVKLQKMTIKTHTFGGGNNTFDFNKSYFLLSESLTIKVQCKHGWATYLKNGTIKSNGTIELNDSVWKGNVVIINNNRRITSPTP